MPLHDMSQAKKREFAFLPPRGDISGPSLGTRSSEITGETAAPTEACGESHSRPQEDAARIQEIAWKVPIVTCSRITAVQKWLCVGVVHVVLEGCSDALTRLPDTLSLGLTFSGELFVEAGTDETAFWFKVRPANDLLQSVSAECLHYLVLRQKLVQLCLVDENPPSVSLRVLVSERLLDTSSEFPRGVARLAIEHFGYLVKALYPEITWPIQLSSSELRLSRFFFSTKLRD